MLCVCVCVVILIQLIILLFIVVPAHFPAIISSPSRPFVVDKHYNATTTNSQLTNNESKKKRNINQNIY